MKGKRFGLGIVIAVLLAGSTTGNAGILRDALQKRAEARNATGAQTSNTMMDVAYGSDKKQRLDVYLPSNPQNAPVIVMVHGGAWKIGDKRSENVVNNKKARWNPKGIIFVSVNYRLLPDADPLKQADDVASALAYVQKHASEWGGDTNKIVLMGHSAGAHLVDLLSSDPNRYPNLKPWLGTVSLDSAAMDIPKVMSMKHYDFYDEAFGTDPAYWADASPYQRLSSHAVPMLLVCSTERPDKPCGQTESFVQKAKSMNLRAEMTPQALKHKEINDELGLESNYTKVVEDFMRSLGMAI
ncbi:alpha/beta hydrolase [Sulfuricurvum sp.]|uniref:alpha/beta hydrolase n=1 Tax=Sulfuricurvum sp. TaxID=2025608 RepID=UPI0026365C8E|nr:alpha/beta hydrolase [Sulfuricurvum sp.]MDD2266880.1 alpha/beta hydrolase [Sulfuricurvum sp.]MDD2784489.1 alpha/beta hydrolase [Sulfuricurvum sp.]